MIHGARSTFLRYLESARAGSTAPRRCVLILAAWDGQAVSRAACRRLRLATRAVTRRFCRNARNCGKSVAVAWPFHPAVAFILSGEMAVAYFMAHAPQGHFFSPALNRGEEAVLYCFIFLFLSVAGGGAWSIDSSRGRR